MNSTQDTRRGVLSLDHGLCAGRPGGIELATVALRCSKYKQPANSKLDRLAGTGVYLPLTCQSMCSHYIKDTRYARAGEKVARLAFEYGNRFYNYKGLRRYKEKFHPEWRSTYFAYPPLTPLPMLLMDSAALIAGGYRRIFFKSPK